MRTCDKNMRPIQVGDTLKVFHFTGARRKKYYMYKHVVGVEYLGGHSGADKVPFFKVSHLDRDGGYYWMGMDDGSHWDVEIVQGYSPHFEDRAKVA